MVPSPLLLLPLLGGGGQVTASALVGRQAAPIVTKFTTVYGGGDPSVRRTADSGYEIRVDTTNGAWGFCATKNANQCDMGDTCVDDTTCTAGCGFGNKALKTWTCPHGRFCSTALLTLSDPAGVYTNLGCGDKPNITDRYQAWTTTPKPSTSTSTSTPSSSSTTSPTTSPSTPGQTTPAASAGSGAPNPASSPSSPSSPSTLSPDPPNNTPAIIGAVVGCVSLICLSVVAVFLIRRSRHAAAGTAAAAAAAGGGGGGGGVDAGAAAGGGGVGATAERGGGGGGVGYNNSKPVMELPAEGLPVYEELPARGPEMGYEVVETPVLGWAEVDRAPATPAELAEAGIGGWGMR
ncbi:hypothetical protein C8A05DRAFT_12600 [Staphylotrichum tortipilum]|uniref:Uncharacterized protein n=1 Tax=Staphylotrichum tortipilum TaxID=2831512 RepID=A0AAN6MSF2_9PEZI|nr:hypothetical protein C8A05DRAFT_12600 [Staphylotrichum longicolle]